MKRSTREEVDAETVFLNGDISEDVNVDLLTPLRKRGRMWNLKKMFYGLLMLFISTFRCLDMKVKDLMEEYRPENSTSDNCRGNENDLDLVKTSLSLVVALRDMNEVNRVLVKLPEKLCELASQIPKYLVFIPEFRLKLRNRTDLLINRLETRFLEKFSLSILYAKFCEPFLDLTGTFCSRGSVRSERERPL